MEISILTGLLLANPEQAQLPAAAKVNPEGEVSSDGIPVLQAPLTAPPTFLPAQTQAILTADANRSSESSGIPAGLLAALAFAARLSHGSGESSGDSHTQAQEETADIAAGKTVTEPQAKPLKAVVATPSRANEQELAAAAKKLPSVDARPEGDAHPENATRLVAEYGVAHAASTPRSTVPATPTFVESRIEAPDLKPAPSAASSSHDIRVRIPDERGGATEVRFLDTGNDVRVSVRTGDADLAHTLRAGLSDLTQRLAANGIQTELWRPGSDQSYSQGGSSHQFLDSNDSGRGGNPFRDAQHDEAEHNRPHWVEELEASTSGSRP